MENQSHDFECAMTRLTRQSSHRSPIFYRFVYRKVIACRNLYDSRGYYMKTQTHTRYSQMEHTSLFAVFLCRKNSRKYLAKMCVSLMISVSSENTAREKQRNRKSGRLRIGTWHSSRSQSWASRIVWRPPRNRTHATLYDTGWER